jgi:hypothetical protein
MRCVARAPGSVQGRLHCFASFDTAQGQQLRAHPVPLPLPLLIDVLLPARHGPPAAARLGPRQLRPVLGPRLGVLAGQEPGPDLRPRRDVLCGYPWQLVEWMVGRGGRCSRLVCFVHCRCCRSQVDGKIRCATAQRAAGCELGCLVCQNSTWHSFLPWHTPVGPIGCPSPVDSCRQSHAMAPQGCPLHGSSKLGRCSRNVPQQYGRCVRKVPSPAIWPLCPNPNPPGRGQGLGANGVETRFELPTGLQVSIASYRKPGSRSSHTG